ncbi:MAG TPA: hypothetical protein VK568_09710 [Thermodesulfobacteriota bacterium]|nr:hypothetical protein [Thermodesulfobacteriota bacterium]
MPSSDTQLLNKIVKKNLYYDKRSRELATNVVKPKYKLAGNSILEEYFFNILTTTLMACKTEFTLTIQQTDWEDKRNGRYLNEPVSYCDLTKYELLDKLTLLKKMRDRHNKFRRVAKLADAKYEQLQNLQTKFASCLYVSSQTKDMIDRGISDALDKIASKLGLK